MTKDIQTALCKYLVGTLKHAAVCENFDYLYEMDVASLTLSGLLHEFEVKVSRSDFLADKKKGMQWGGISKFDHYETSSFRRPNYFHYVCPESLIDENEIPSFAGLYYYSNGTFWKIKSCKRIHNDPLDTDKILRKMLRLHTQRKYLGYAWMTWKNNEAKKNYPALTGSELTEKEQ